MPGNWQAEALKKLGNFASGHYAVVIRLKEQTLYLFCDESLIYSYPISSSLFGVGSAQDSKRTPLGIHRVAEKIGSGCASGEIIVGRVPTGEQAEIVEEKKSTNKDLITSRILWLQGLEPGINSGQDIDSFKRYIYIHGTNEEGLIGRPASNGCIRMKNAHIIELFQKVDVDTVVLILFE